MSYFNATLRLWLKRLPLENGRETTYSNKTKAVSKMPERNTNMKLNLDITLPIAAYVEDLSIIYFVDI